MNKILDNVAIIEVPQFIDPSARVEYEEKEDDYDTCKKNVLDWLQNIIAIRNNLNFIVKWPDGTNSNMYYERYEIYEAIIKNFRGEVPVLHDYEKMAKEITLDPETLNVQIELRNGIVITSDNEHTPTLFRLLEGIERGLIEVYRDENYSK